MRLLWIAFGLVVACAPKPERPLRPFQAGTFDGYSIEPCKAADGTARGHVVRLTKQVEERGEAASPERVETYRDRYLIPALEDTIRVTGWNTSATCARGGLTLQVDAKQDKAYGEALHRIGETLRDNPTDIEVVLVLSGPGK
jgi:hypothetical protein